MPRRGGAGGLAGALLAGAVLLAAAGVAAAQGELLFITHWAQWGALAARHSAWGRSEQLAFQLHHRGRRQPPRAAVAAAWAGPRTREPPARGTRTPGRPGGAARLLWAGGSSRSMSRADCIRLNRPGAQAMTKRATAARAAQGAGPTRS